MTSTARPPILRQLGQAAILIALTLAAFYPILRNGFIWDDDRYIEQNIQLRTPTGLENIWLQPLKAEPRYYPLTHTTLWLEYQLWSQNPLGYHLDNLILHTASALLLWRLLLRLKIPGSFIAAIIFSIHPIQVESVAWATERKNVLSGFFYLLTLWTYLHTKWGRKIWTDDDTKKPNLIWYILTLLFFAAALLSKSVTSTLPAAILLLCWWRTGKIRTTDIYPLIPMFIAGIAMGSLTGWMEKHIVGAIGPDFDFLTPLDRICIAGKAIWFYIAKLICPINQSFIYPHWDINPTQKPWQLLYPLSVAMVVGGLSLLVIRPRSASSSTLLAATPPRQFFRGPITAALFFIGTLFPALGFVNVFPMRYSYVADHFQYLACIGPIVLIVAFLAQRQTQKYALALAAIAIPILCIATNLRARVYHDRKTLWADTLQKNPTSPVARNNYAVELMHAGDLEAAKSQFRAAMNLRQDAADWVGLGQCFYLEGNFAAARDMYFKALAATPDSPEPVFQHLRAGREFQLGAAYQALAHQAMRLETDSPAQHYRFKAIQAYQRAIDLFPEYEDPRTNLAVLLIEENQIPEAINQCNIVLAQNPDSISARKNLGAAYYAQGRLDKALNEYNQVLKIDPENPDAMASAGAILARQGDLNTGISLLEKSLALDPNNAMAHQNLLAALKKLSH
jgi:tetratricopeptide (TPR) repeat protein